jgi:hypothetical protein
MILAKIATNIRQHTTESEIGGLVGLCAGHGAMTMHNGGKDDGDQKRADPKSFQYVPAPPHGWFLPKPAGSEKG